MLNEYPLIAISPDYFRGIFKKEQDCSIGYCGHMMFGRKKYLQTLLNSSLKCNFVLRQGFWAPGVDKKVARQEYFENMENNIFTFCYRGAGNFSYRFYETFMMGRIPILINTDSIAIFRKMATSECGNYGGRKRCYWKRICINKYNYFLL